MMQPSPIRDLGLQHVLENALSILRSEAIADQRRAQVIESIIELLNEADKGSSILKSNSLAVSSNEGPALQSFSIFHKCLGQSQDVIESRLNEAKALMSDVASGRSPELAERKSVEALFAGLLAFIKRERSLIPLSSSKEYRFL